MKLLLSICALATLAAVTRASACIPAPADQLFALGADFVVIGTATGTSEESFELTVSYDVVEVLLGKAPETRIGVSPCSDPIHKGERVVVGRVHGKQYVYPAASYEQQVRASIHAGR